MKSEDASWNESGINRIDLTVKKDVEIMEKIISSLETNLQPDVIRELDGFDLLSKQSSF